MVYCQRLFARWTRDGEVVLAERSKLSALIERCIAVIGRGRYETAAANVQYPVEPGRVSAPPGLDQSQRTCARQVRHLPNAGHLSDIQPRTTSFLFRVLPDRRPLPGRRALTPPDDSGGPTPGEARCPARRKGAQERARLPC